jgi:hypothetical protein
MALYGNDADSKALARRLSETAFKRDADYHSHTHTAYFEMLNLHRFAMALALPYESPPIRPQAVRPPVAQQWATLVTGTSEITAQNETRKGTFEIFGDEQARLIRMDVQGMSFELTVDENDTGGNTGTGQLSPCEGSYCPCKMTELEDRVKGSCDDPDYPDLGVFRFTLCLGGETACEQRVARIVPPPAARPPRAVQQPAVRPPPPIVVQRPVVRPPPPPPRAVSQPVEQQWEMMATGRGKIIAQGGSYEANFQILGDGDIARNIKLAYGGLSQEIKIADEDAGGGNATGQMSPCNGGNCPCNMAEVEDRIEGSCRNTAFPELGDMRFILCLGDPSACQQKVVRQPVVRPPAPKVVQQPVVRPPAPKVVQQPVVRPPPIVVQQPVVRPPPPTKQPVQPPAYKPPPPAKPQLVRIASGTGDFNDSQANFEFWGIDGQPTLLRIRARGGPWEVGINAGQNNQDQITGRLTPCRGGVCACELWEEGENYLQGSCTIGPGQESFMSINITAQY